MVKDLQEALRRIALPHPGNRALAIAGLAAAEARVNPAETAFARNAKVLGRIRPARQGKAVMVLFMESRVRMFATAVAAVAAKLIT